MAEGGVLAGVVLPPGVRLGVRAMDNPGRIINAFKDDAQHIGGVHAWVVTVLTAAAQCVSAEDPRWSEPAVRSSLTDIEAAFQAYDDAMMSFAEKDVVDRFFATGELLAELKEYIRRLTASLTCLRAALGLAGPIGESDDDEDMPDDTDYASYRASRLRSETRRVWQQAFQALRGALPNAEVLAALQADEAALRRRVKALAEEAGRGSGGGDGDSPWEPAALAKLTESVRPCVQCTIKRAYRRHGVSVKVHGTEFWAKVAAALGPEAGELLQQRAAGQAAELAERGNDDQEEEKGGEDDAVLPTRDVAVRAQQTVSEAELLEAAKQGDMQRIKLLLADPEVNINATDDVGGATALHIALRYPELVRVLLRAGAYVDAPMTVGGWAGYTPLQYACLSAPMCEAVELLLAAGADKEVLTENDGRTPLLTAVGRGMAEAARALLAAGADAGVRDHEGRGWLQLAVEGSHYDLAVELLEAGAPLGSATGEDGGGGGGGGGGKDNLINEALGARCQELAVALVKAGADKDARDEDGDPVIFNATQLEYGDLVAELIRAGADTKARNSQGQSLLRYALEVGEAEIPMLLLLNGGTAQPLDDDDKGLLNEAIQLGEEVAVAMLRAGADMDTADEVGDSPLHNAVRKQYVGLLRALVAAGADVNTPNRNGTCYAPLFRAAVRNNAEMVRILSDAGADKEWAHPEEGTALGIAVAEGHDGAAVALLEAGACMTAGDKDGETPLLLACRNGRLQVVEKLLAAGASVEARNKDGETPLLQACRSGRLQVVEKLLAAGASVQAGNKAGCTPLMAAAQEGHTEVARVLLRAGADKDAVRYEDGRTALHLAAECGCEELVGVLLEAGVHPDGGARQTEQGGCTPLHLGAKHGSAGVVRALLRAGANKDATQEDGRMPLINAAEGGHCAAAVALLEAGASTECSCKENGWTPLLFCAWDFRSFGCEDDGGRDGIPAALIKAGANVHVIGKDSKTALTGAVRKSNFALVQLLLEAGAKVHSSAQDADLLSTALECGCGEDVALALMAAGADMMDVDLETKDTPLHHACARGMAAVVEKLLRAASAHVNALNERGCTPLLMAARSGSEAVVEQLLAAGAELEAVDQDGATPLILAASSYSDGSPGVVQALLRAGAKKDTEDEAGATALHHAINQERFAAARILQETGAHVNPTAEGAGELLPLLISAGEEQQDLAIGLVTAGVDKDAIWDGEAPLHVAARCGRLAVLQALIDAGAFLEARNSAGETPLVVAAAAADCEQALQMVRALLKAGADPNAANEDGDTALHVAAAKPNTGCVEALLEAGARKDMTNRAGVTTGDVASSAASASV